MWKSLVSAAALVFVTMQPAASAEITLRLHQFLPPQAPIPANFLEPWIEKVEQESGGRIEIQHYPAMQLGGSPASLYEQVRDGVVDLIWTLPGYTPGVFPKSETFELPFMTKSSQASSQALWEFYEKHLVDEFDDVHVITMHTHGPGLLHVKGDPVETLEDMQGLKLRGPTRVISSLLSELGAMAVGMPVPSVPESLSKGVIDGAVVPWEVTRSIRLAELTDAHTSFGGDAGLYTATFLFAMNKARFEALPDDLKAVIDANSGLEAARWAGRVMDEGDAPGLAAAKEQGNTLVEISAADAEAWKQAAQPVVDHWIEEMDGLGFDGAALLEDARALITKYDTAAQ
ncbi:MAG TPA: TRAP transporter substrate-binding protein [Alphaproteobacteria bacterium]|nr:TRAP transporter substrate-binding protein [Alphaproteobacteria bacterium]